MSDDRREGDSILRVNRSRNLDAPLHALTNDGRLSWKAVGLLTYLVTRPDGWKFFKADLISRHDDGKTSVESGLKELREAGYLSMDQERTGDGTFRTRWEVRDTPPQEDRTGKSGPEAGKSCRTGLSAPDYPRAENRGTEVTEEERGRDEGSSSGLRPSPGTPGEEDEGQDGFSREGWIQDIREADPETFASALFVEGLRGLLYGGTDLPEAAPEGYDLSADLAKLRRRFDALGNEGVAELLLGLSALRESGELGGVDPGEGLTLGLVNRIDQQLGRSVWGWARKVGRREMAEDEDQGFLEQLMEDEGVEGAA